MWLEDQRTIWLYVESRAERGFYMPRMLLNVFQTTVLRQPLKLTEYFTTAFFAVWDPVYKHTRQCHTIINTYCQSVMLLMPARSLSNGQGWVNNDLVDLLFLSNTDNATVTGLSRTHNTVYSILFTMPIVSWQLNSFNWSTSKFQSIYLCLLQRSAGRNTSPIIWITNCVHKKFSLWTGLGIWHGHSASWQTLDMSVVLT